MRTNEVLQGGLTYHVADDDAIREVAEAQRMTLREAQHAALTDGVVPLRYLRDVSPNLPPHHLARLLEARVALVGLGGLGGYVLEGLVRHGVGRIRAADGDVFEEHNTNRQLLCTAATLDAPKAVAAAGRAALINPAVELDARDERISDAAMDDFVAGCDVAVDCLGGFGGRTALAKAAREATVPLVTAAMAGDTGYITVVPANSDVDPSAFFPASGGGDELRLGAPVETVMCLAALMVRQVRALLLEDGAPLATPLASRMLIVDLQRMTFDTMTLSV